MHPNPESRSRYLSLALASRKVIKSLLAYVEGGQRDEQMKTAIGDVVRSLTASRDTNKLFGTPPTESPFTNYEQLSTIEEVAELRGRTIVDQLTALLKETATSTERQKEVNEAVEFFYTLENRALHHYNQQIGSRDL